MNAIRIEARQKGLRMAAKVAAIAGLLAASAAYGQAEAAEAHGGKIEGAKSSDRAAVLADQVKLRAQSGRCGCSPCWGPPAPPEMDVLS